ncbi:hypothetical protein EDB85DRAFT_2213653 [Lactarius pseudohatsudake]|nr:hypothetical protein EDB85DRAFT_2213653 [Lactarius pseudohatsudake]
MPGLGIVINRSLCLAGLFVLLLHSIMPDASNVQQDNTAKAQAKKACQEERQQNINDLAEFKHANMANSSDGEALDNPVETPSCSEKSATKDNSSLESADDDDDDPPPAKRLKAQTTQKATAAAGEKAVGKEPTGKKNNTNHHVQSFMAQWTTQILFDFGNLLQ